MDFHQIVDFGKLFCVQKNFKVSVPFFESTLCLHSFKISIYMKQNINFTIIKAIKENILNNLLQTGTI